jgi:hypothetical protein
MNSRSDRGQATVLTLVFLVVLLGMAALVLDMGSWYRADRSTQSTADAAALAGAQALPEDPNTARTLAAQFATKNGGLGSAASRSLEDRRQRHDQRRGQAAGAGLLLEDLRRQERHRRLDGDREVGGRLVRQVRGADHRPLQAPAAELHRALDASDLQPGLHARDDAQPRRPAPEGRRQRLRRVRLLNLNFGDPHGNIGAGTLADWLLHGYGDYLPLGTYFSAPSANFNNSQFQDSMTQVIGKEVLFPVYRLLTGPGSNAKYDIIGWVGFVIRTFDPSGSSGTITGHFTTYNANGSR